MPCKIARSVLVLPFLAVTAFGQANTGVAHPDQDTDVVKTTDHYVKPSHDTNGHTAVPVYQDSFPATAPAPKLLTRDDQDQPGAAAYPAAASPAYSASPLQTAEAVPAHPGLDPADGEIVLRVPDRANELHRGTLLHARLREALSTERTAEGALFTAELISDAGQAGQVLLPAGSLLRGHVTSIHGGKRISGGASMYLRPETISLPDGTLYRLEAQVSGVDGTQDLRVTDEGKIVLHSNPKAAAAVVGGVAATAAVTGAVVGGGVGAAVGAVAGAGVGTAVYLKRDVQESLPAGSDIIFALNQSLAVTPH